MLNGGHITNALQALVNSEVKGISWEFHGATSMHTPIADILTYGARTMYFSVLLSVHSIGSGYNLKALRETLLAVSSQQAE